MKPNEKKAKEIFSRYVRVRDCVKTSGTPHIGKCFTCGRVFTYDELHCGHFVSGRGNSLFFEEHNSTIQCGTCNTSLGGNPEVYRKKMINKYGIEEVERLESLRHVPVKIRESEFKELSIKFDIKFKNMLD